MHKAAFARRERGKNHYMEHTGRVILCKYGEVALKGANRPQFESAMMRELRRRAEGVGRYEIWSAQSTVYIEPQDEGSEARIEEMYGEASHVFGFSGICIAASAEKDIDRIREAAAEYVPGQISGCRTFKVEAKRSDKRFPHKSPEIAASVGEAILDVMPELTVDLHDPDVTVMVEVRERCAYIHAGQERGAGGLPSGTNGRALLLLSGGIDSPVAGYMMMKRGVTVDAVHFESMPYTSEQAREKVLALASILTDWCGEMRVHVISVTHIQEALRDNCDNDYFTILLRRFMMALADRTARHTGAQALVTGESLGQVASQTMHALAATDCKTTLPVFRPCIGMDKEEIVVLSRKIGAFETSILPYEDCCTVFTPQHPKTRPEIEKVEAQEALVDFDGLCEEAWQGRRLFYVRRGLEQKEYEPR